MCTILVDSELVELGVDLNSRREFDRLGTVGCHWIGQPIRLRLERHQDTVPDYVARRNTPTFKLFRENAINDRVGAQISVMDPREDCVQLMDGGSVSLAVGVALAFGADPTGFDPCAEALRIAEMIEPRLP